CSLIPRFRRSLPTRRSSDLVDYFHFQGYLRWFLIILFMLLKAGLIVAVFMHMLWERLALMYAILVPTVLLMVLLGIGALEADYRSEEHTSELQSLRQLVCCV